MNPIYKGQLPPKNPDVIWICGKEVRIFQNGGWVAVNESTIIDPVLDPTSNHAIANSAVATALNQILNNAEEQLSETSENFIKNKAVYNQYMNAEEAARICTIINPDYIIDYLKTVPLTFDIISNVIKTIEYKKNNGEWTSITSTYSGVNIDVVAGDRLQFRGNNSAYGASDAQYSARFASTARFNVKGNIMSLISSSNFSTLETLSANYTFNRMFSESLVVDASELLLPAKTLSQYCYAGMFYNCTTLTSAPIMYGVDGANYSACYMYYGCTSLTKVPALKLMTLKQRTCRGMFYGCTALVNGPDLPAVNCSSYGDEAYRELFYGCSSLNNVKCMLVSRYSTYTVENMFTGVPNTGTLYKNPNLATWFNDSSLPSGWTIVNAEV